MTFTALIQFLFNATLVDTPITDFSTGTSQTRFGLSDDQQPVTISNGSSANQANKLYRAKMTMTAGQIITLDLQALTLPNDPSTTPDVTQLLTRLVGIAVRIPTNSDAILRIGGAATNAWEAWTPTAGAKWDVRDFDFKLDRSATAFVVDSTHKNLKLENAGLDGDVIIVIFGS